MLRYPKQIYAQAFDTKLGKGLIILSCCSLCYRDKEDINNIFLQCDFVNSIWNILHSTFNVQINRSEDLKNLFLSAFKAQRALRFIIFGLIELFHYMEIVKWCGF